MDRRRHAWRKIVHLRLYILYKLSSLDIMNINRNRMTIWTSEQDKALKNVAAWLESTATNQVFRLFGYAGTGKSTLARHLVDHVDENVVFAAYTGKAALVMRAKGCKDASTIHSLIYRATDTDTEEPSFVLNNESMVSSAKLIVIDECSMVDEELGRDLLSFGKKVLVLGDPAQLPPIRGGGFFTDCEPDVMLTQVHRQAADDPIIRLSMMARSGEEIKPGDFGETRIVLRKNLDPTYVTNSDQVLVGLNKTRRSYNTRLRDLRGFKNDFPVAGEKLVCLRNNRKKGLLNGALFTVKSAGALRKGKIRLLITPEEEPTGKFQRVAVLPEFFSQTEIEIPYALRKGTDEFEYGYALTVHKAQGSQWDSVTLFDESCAFREHRSRWLYTGITRAAKSLTLVM